MELRLAAHEPPGSAKRAGALLNFLRQPPSGNLHSPEGHHMHVVTPRPRQVCSGHQMPYRGPALARAAAARVVVAVPAFRVQLKEEISDVLLKREWPALRCESGGWPKQTSE